MTPRHNVHIEAAEHGKDAQISIDGHALRGVRRAEVLIDAADATVVRLEIFCTVNRPDPSHWIHADQIINFINSDEKLEAAIRDTINSNGIDATKFREAMLLELKLDELVIES